MKLGATLWPQNTTWAAMREAAQLLDRVGFETVWTWDHFYALAGREESPNFEAWQILPAWAALTKRIRMGALVSGITYRHPAIFANMAATLDHISDGRAILGIGAAWNTTEHDAFGIHLGTPGERSRRLAEASKVIRALLDGERVTYDGAYYHLTDAVLNVRPVQRHLPIMIGGGGERKTLLTAAKYADQWHAFAPAETMRRKIGILHQHLRDVGRDPSAVEPWGGQWVCVRDDPEDARAVLDEIRTHHPGWAGPSAIVGDADHVAAQMKEHWEAGVRGFIVG